jgi:hypothetical protein
MHRKIHLAFGIIWIIGVIAFAWLAIDAWHMTHIKLARYTFRIPANYNVSISGVNFQDVINQIAETQEQNTKILEASIHTSYRTALWANGLSCFAALCGVFTQFFHWRHEEKRDIGRDTNQHPQEKESPESIGNANDTNLADSYQQHENTTAPSNETRSA